MDNLLFTFNAVLPIIFCILIGYFVKRLKIFPDNFWSLLNKLCFRVFLPILLFKNIYDISNISSMATYWKSLVFVSVAIISIFAVGLLIVILLIKEPSQKGVVLQCIFRSNYAIIGIGLIELLCANMTGADITLAKGIGAVISAVSIPIFNILAIISLTIFVKEEGNKVSVKEILIKICKNPLIIGVLTGILFLVIRNFIPSVTNDNGDLVPVFTIRYFMNTNQTNDTFIYTTVKYLANAATPTALIALGGAFSFSAVSKYKFQIILATSIRTVIVPATCLFVAWLLKFDKLYFPSFIALFSTPVAVSSAAMASEMKNDGELAGQLVVWNTLVSAITLFLIILVCSNLGLV